MTSNTMKVILANAYGQKECDDQKIDWCWIMRTPAGN